MALDPRTPLPDLGVALAGSRFEEAAACIQATLAEANITTIRELENATKYLTCSFCGIPTNKFISYVYRYLADPPAPVAEVVAPEVADVEDVVEADKTGEAGETGEAGDVADKPAAPTGKPRKANRKG